jgi:hypothetical protein
MGLVVLIVSDVYILVGIYNFDVSLELAFIPRGTFTVCDSRRSGVSAGSCAVVEVVDKIACVGRKSHFDETIALLSPLRVKEANSSGLFRWVIQDGVAKVGRLR